MVTDEADVVHVRRYDCARRAAQPRRRGRVLSLSHPVMRRREMLLPHDTFVVVADGRKMLFFRNQGDAAKPDLVVEHSREHGKAWGRERGCQYVEYSVVDVSLNNN